MGLSCVDSQDPFYKYYSFFCYFVNYFHQSFTLKKSYENSVFECLLMRDEVTLKCFFLQFFTFKNLIVIEVFPTQTNFFLLPVEYLKIEVKEIQLENFYC